MLYLGYNYIEQLKAVISNVKGHIDIFYISITWIM